MTRLTEAAWADIAGAYAAGDETVAAIAARHGIDRGAIIRRAQADGWPRRRAPSHAPRAPTERAQAALMRRLFNAIKTKLKHLETSMKSGKAMSAADSERQTRQINHLIRSFEKVTELARARDNAASGSGAPGGASISTADAERMRAEIAERLERLAQAKEQRG